MRAVQQGGCWLNLPRRITTDHDPLLRFHRWQANLRTLEIERDGNRVTLSFEANGFLKHMVRNITGSLVQVGLGRMKVEDVKNNLEALSRESAPPKAPPQGLMLVEVYY